jgi:hypothetical protein
MKHFALLAALFMLCVVASALRAEDAPAAPAAPAEHVKAELPKPDADGWISLFNGKDLTGWDGDPTIWRVENGYISGKIEKVPHGNTFLIYDHPFKNFVLEANCQLIRTGKFPNSGIQYRSKMFDPKTWVVGGYQADMGENYWGTLYEERGRGGLGKVNKEAQKTVTDAWNKYTITANGNHLKHELNGVTALELEDKHDPNDKKSLYATEGLIALQYHAPGGFECRFKDIRIKILPDTENK